MFKNSPLDVAGNLDYKNLCYVITHREAKGRSRKGRSNRRIKRRGAAEKLLPVNGVDML